MKYGDSILLFIATTRCGSNILYLPHSIGGRKGGDQQETRYRRETVGLLSNQRPVILGLRLVSSLGTRSSVSVTAAVRVTQNPAAS